MTTDIIDGRHLKRAEAQNTLLPPVSACLFYIHKINNLQLTDPGHHVRLDSIKVCLSRSDGFNDILF